MSGNCSPTARPLAALAFLGASVASALAATLRLGGMEDRVWRRTGAIGRGEERGVDRDAARRRRRGAGEERSIEEKNSSRVAKARASFFF